MSETWKRAFCIISISALILLVMVRILKLQDSSLVQGDSDSVIQDEQLIDGYIRSLSDYKNKSNLTTRVGIKFVNATNDYRQGGLRDYYNSFYKLSGKERYTKGICWASAILSTYRYYNPTTRKSYLDDGIKIINKGRERYPLVGISNGIFHSSAVGILNDMFEDYKINKKSSAWSISDRTNYNKYFDEIQSEVAAGNVSLFQIPGHEMAACGYCTVRVQWREGSKIKTKFEDMIMVCDTWHDRKNRSDSGSPLPIQYYSFYPKRELYKGLYYGLGIVRNK